MAKAKSKPTTAKKSQQSSRTAPPSSHSDQAEMDPMSQCVALCQEQRWREALLLCRRMRSKADAKQDANLYASLEGAQAKIEYSLRRQMAASVVHHARHLLAKEFLLDVGE